MLNDTEYRDQQLQSRKAARDRKRKTIEDNPLHIDARKEADRLAKFRRVIKEADETRNAQEREEMIEKVHQRYFSSQFFYLIHYCAVQNSGYFSSKLDQTIFLFKEASVT